MKIYGLQADDASYRLKVKEFIELNKFTKLTFFWQKELPKEEEIKVGKISMMGTRISNECRFTPSKKNLNIVQRMQNVRKNYKKRIPECLKKEKKKKR